MVKASSNVVSFCLLYLSSFTYLFISTEDPVNSKQILFTAGMVGDYSGLSIYIYKLKGE